MEIIILFLPGPIAYVVLALFPRSWGLGLMAMLAVVAVFFYHAGLPSITGNDAAGNGMANGFRALGFFSLIAGLIAAGLLHLLSATLSRSLQSRGAKIAMFLAFLPVAILGQFLVLR